MKYAILSDIHGNTIALDDVAAVLAQIEKSHHPASDYIRRFYKGEMIPNWYKEWRKT